MVDRTGDRYVPRDLLLEDPEEFGRTFHAARKAMPVVPAGAPFSADEQQVARVAALRQAQWLAAKNQHELAVLVRDYLESTAQNRGAHRLALAIGRQYDWMGRVLNGVKVMQWHDAVMLQMKLAADPEYRYVDRLRFFKQTSSRSR